VGLVIGTQGETISGIQKLTRTSINCAKFCEPGKSERRIEISGLRENIDEAKNRIQAICDEVGDKPKKSELKAMQMLAATCRLSGSARSRAASQDHRLL